MEHCMHPNMNIACTQTDLNDNRAGQRTFQNHDKHKSQHAWARITVSSRFLITDLNDNRAGQRTFQNHDKHKSQHAWTRITVSSRFLTDLNDDRTGQVKQYERIGQI